METPLFSLVDPSRDLVEAWQVHFADCDRVAVVHGRFEEVDAYDCLVSPANSFGLMDGGVDAAITAFFGDQLMARVQERILMEFLGEQPVGTSMVVATGHAEHPWLAHSPTMRVPMDIRGTDHVYKAMLATIQAVARANELGAGIAHVVCPGLGTGYGRMSADEAARQMRAAYQTLLQVPAALTWRVAGAKQRQVGVRPGQPVAGGLNNLLRKWQSWDYAAFEVARSLGLTGGSAFGDYKAELWDPESPLRAFLLRSLEELVALGQLESRKSAEVEYRWKS